MSFEQPITYHARYGDLSKVPYLLIWGVNKTIYVRAVIDHTKPFTLPNPCFILDGKSKSPLLLSLVSEVDIETDNKESRVDFLGEKSLGKVVLRRKQNWIEIATEDVCGSIGVTVVFPEHNTNHRFASLLYEAVKKENSLFKERDARLSFQKDRRYIVFS